jgi:hypothetical protein
MQWVELIFLHHGSYNFIRKEDCETKALGSSIWTIRQLGTIKFRPENEAAVDLIADMMICEMREDRMLKNHKMIKTLWM